MMTVVSLMEERGRLITRHAEYERQHKRKAALMTWVRLADITNKILREIDHCGESAA